MASPVRDRFAPSPTGLLHVGNARTALYNWLFARQSGGVYILRIEDTDLARSERQHEEQLLQDLRWLGLDWDFGPETGAPETEWRQSDRLPVYHEHARQLLAEGKAYRCFCTQAELEAERQRAMAEHRPQVYSGRCRSIPAEESEGRAAQEPFVVRLRIPDGPLTFHDIVRGTVTFASQDVSDPVLVRSGETGAELGVPVYNFVVTVDDALMRITHVIRGDDHLSNTPKQVAIYQAFGWPLPEFAHLSTILGEDRQRLSKRHGATSIASFREMGYLPEALVNYLALLGWAPPGGDREIFSPEELVREFSLARVTPSPAVFDFNKLNWLNRHYLKSAEPARVAELALPHFVNMQLLPSQLSGAAQEWFHLLLQMVLPSVDRLDELPARAGLVFSCDAAIARADAENAPLLAAESAASVVKDFAARMEHEAAPLSAARFKELVNETKTATGVKGKELFMPIRIAITGSAHGPEFDKLVPVIEQGSRLGLPAHIPSIAARVAAFAAE